MIGMTPLSCSRCYPCRINRARIWTHRLLLENAKHGDSAFVTLTYDAENLPRDGNLVPEHTQAWLKDFRRAILPKTVRFFLSGEYGAETCRPHYHVVLFGYPSCFFGESRYKFGFKRCCWSCDTVRDTWKRGNVFVSGVGRESVAYVAGYVIKKLESYGDKRLEGKREEFRRMSLRPGIGADAVVDIARALGNYPKWRELVEGGDVPGALRSGGEILPLGRYLRGKLRERVGFGSREVPEEAKRAYARELRRVFEEDIRIPENRSKSVGKIALDKMAQKCLNVVARHRIFKPTGVI